MKLNIKNFRKFCIIFSLEPTVVVIFFTESKCQALHVLLRTDGIFDIYIFSVGANLGSSCVRILVDVPMCLGLEGFKVRFFWSPISGCTHSMFVQAVWRGFQGLKLVLGKSWFESQICQVQSS